VKLPPALGVVETNSIDYVRILFNALNSRQVVAPLRSSDDEQRKQIAGVSDVIVPEDESGWFSESLVMTSDAEIAHISFTSGTEGTPKGVLLSRTALCDVVERVQSLMQMTEEVREYIGVPVYHSFGYGRCRHVASVGGEFYVPGNGFDPREVSQMLADKTINALSLVPSLLRVFIHNPGVISEEGANLRWLEIGSQAMSVEEKIAVRNLFPNARIIQHYGLTEASRTTLLQIDGADEIALASVGKAYGDCEIRVNSDGRICIQGKHVASGLLIEGEFLEVGSGQWFETTDLGSIDGNYLYFKGRADNVVNCGGQKISTDALELAIAAKMKSMSHTFAVSKIPHRIYGEGFLLSFTADCDQVLLKNSAAVALAEGGIKAKNVTTMNPVENIPKTHTGKTQHKILSAGYEAIKSESAHPDVSAVQKIFIETLGLESSELKMQDSATDIGIDSIQSVQLSLNLEKRLGYLPTKWRTQSIAELDALTPKARLDEKPNVASSTGKAEPIWDGSSNRNPEGIGFWKLIKEDYVTHDREFFSQGLFAIFVNRFGNWRMGIGSKFLRVPMTLLYRLLRKMAQVFCGIKLDYTVHVGRRVKLEHFGGMILGARSIGDDTIIRQNTTCGIRDITDLSAKPTIENGVNIGAGVVIVGDIIIGRYSVIGPNCVITESLPPFSVVSSAPVIVKSPGTKGNA